VTTTIYLVRSVGGAYMMDLLVLVFSLVVMARKWSGQCPGVAQIAFVFLG